MTTRDAAARAIPVSTATPDERARMMSTLMLAFICSPMARWLYPEPHAYATFIPRLFDAMGGRAFEHGTAFYAGHYTGVALWLPPGIEPDIEALSDIRQRSLSSEKLEAIERLALEMERIHPAEPHWYLALVGVDPNYQGRGYGAALLEQMLDHIDEEHGLVSLEASNPDNLALYQRFGFEVIGKSDVPGMPPFHVLARQPR